MIDLDVLARVLAKLRFSQVNTTIGSTTAMITCDLSDAMRPQWTTEEYLRFWEVIARAQREVEAR